MRISDWSSDVCSSDLVKRAHPGCLRQIVAANIRRHRKARGLSQQNFAFDIEMDRTYFGGIERGERNVSIDNIERIAKGLGINAHLLLMDRSEEHTSELQSLMRISYAVFCLKKKK